MKNISNNKKAMEMSLETIVIFIIVLIVFIVVVFFFVTKYSENSSTIVDLGEQNIDNFKTLFNLKFKL